MSRSLSTGMSRKPASVSYGGTFGSAGCVRVGTNCFVREKSAAAALLPSSPSV
jgi:hypothetical protein